jgi:serine protease Do
MTNGIISAINRNISYNGHNMTLLQTNAALNEGNSGGPLVNAYGQVVGITNMKIMSSYYTTVEGIGFAIPSKVVKQIADQLIADGVVSGYPTIGIVAGAVSTEAQRLYDLPNGVYVSQVNDGSDAKTKGMQVGDIILAVNGQSVTSVAEVNAIKEGFGVGDTLTLTIYREGETFDLDVVLVDQIDLG